MFSFLYIFINFFLSIYYQLNVVLFLCTLYKFEYKFKSTVPLELVSPTTVQYSVYPSLQVQVQIRYFTVLVLYYCISEYIYSTLLGIQYSTGYSVLITAFLFTKTL